jgi:hypothetical protein
MVSERVVEWSSIGVTEYWVLINQRHPLNKHAFERYFSGSRLCFHPPVSESDCRRLRNERGNK